MSSCVVAEGGQEQRRGPPDGHVQVHGHTQGAVRRGGQGEGHRGTEGRRRRVGLRPGIQGPQKGRRMIRDSGPVNNGSDPECGCRY